MSGATDWEAFISGSSADAAARFADLYAETGDQPTLYNLGLALLDGGDYQTAREAFESIIKHASESQTVGEADFIYRGLIEWGAQRPDLAVTFWKRALSAPYVDDGGGVTAPAFLWYAGSRLNDPVLLHDATKRLEKFRFGRKGDWIDRWPGSRAIAAFLLGEVDAETFSDRWTAGPGDNVLEIRRRSRVSFWVASKMVERTERRKFLTAAIADKHAILECEYSAAKIELAQM